MSPTLDRRRAIVSLAGIGVAGFATSRSALAQSTPAAETTPADGAAIVVTVTGSASAPATHAIGQIILRAQYSPMPTDEPMAGTTQPRRRSAPRMSKPSSMPSLRKASIRRRS